MDSKLQLKSPQALDTTSSTTVAMEEKLSPLGLGLGLKPIPPGSDSSIYFPPRETSPKQVVKTVSALSMLLSASASVSAQNSPSVSAASRSKSISPYSVPSAASSATPSVVGHAEYRNTGSNIKSRTSTLNDLRESDFDSDDDDSDVREVVREKEGDKDNGQLPPLAQRSTHKAVVGAAIANVAESYSNQFGSFGASFESHDMDLGSSDDSGFGGESLVYVDDTELEKEMEKRNQQRMNEQWDRSYGEAVEDAGVRHRSGKVMDLEESIPQSKPSTGKVQESQSYSLFSDIEIEQVASGDSADFFANPISLNTSPTPKGMTTGSFYGSFSSSDFGETLPSDAVAFSIEDLSSLPVDSIPHYGEYKTRSTDDGQHRNQASRGQVPAVLTPIPTPQTSGKEATATTRPQSTSSKMAAAAVAMFTRSPARPSKTESNNTESIPAPAATQTSSASKGKFSCQELILSLLENNTNSDNSSNYRSIDPSYDGIVGLGKSLLLENTFFSSLEVTSQQKLARLQLFAAEDDGSPMDDLPPFSLQTDILHLGVTDFVLVDRVTKECVLHVRLSQMLENQRERNNGRYNESTSVVEAAGNQRYTRDYSAIMESVAKEEEFYVLEEEGDDEDMENDLDEDADERERGRLRLGLPVIAATTPVRRGSGYERSRDNSRDTEESSPSPFEDGRSSSLSRENSDQAADTIQFFRTDTDESLLAKEKEASEKEKEKQKEKEKEKEKRGSSSGVMSFFGFGKDREKEKEKERERENERESSSRDNSRLRGSERDHRSSSRGKERGRTKDKSDDDKGNRRRSSSGNLLMISCRKPGSERWKVAKELHITAEGSVVQADKEREEALEKRRLVNPNASSAIPIVNTNAISAAIGGSNNMGGTDDVLLPRRHSDRPYDGDRDRDLILIDPQLQRDKDREREKEKEKERERERANEIYFKYGAMPMANRSQQKMPFEMDTLANQPPPPVSDASLEEYVRKWSDFGGADSVSIGDSSTIQSQSITMSVSTTKSRSTSYSNLTSSSPPSTPSKYMTLNPHTSSLSFIEYTPSKKTRKMMQLMKGDDHDNNVDEKKDLGTVSGGREEIAKKEPETTKSKQVRDKQSLSIDVHTASDEHLGEEFESPTSGSGSGRKGRNQRTQSDLSYEEFLSRLTEDDNSQGDGPNSNGSSSKDSGSNKKKKETKRHSFTTPPKPSSGNKQPPSLVSPLSIKHPSTLSGAGEGEVDRDSISTTGAATNTTIGGGGVGGTSISSQSFLFPNDKEDLMDGQDTPQHFKSSSTSSRQRDPSKQRKKSDGNIKSGVPTLDFTAASGTADSTKSTKSDSKKKELILEGKEFKRHIAFDSSLGNITPRREGSAKLGQSKDDATATPRQTKVSTRLLSPADREDLMPRRHTFNTVTGKYDDDFDTVNVDNQATQGGDVNGPGLQAMKADSGSSSNQSTPSRSGTKTRSWTFSRFIGSVFGFSSNSNSHGDNRIVTEFSPVDGSSDLPSTGGESSTAGSDATASANSQRSSKKRGSGVPSRDGSRHDVDDLPVILPSNAPQSVLLSASEKVADRLKR